MTDLPLATRPVGGPVGGHVGAPPAGAAHATAADLAAVFDRVCNAVEAVVAVDPRSIELAVMCMFAGGHLLIEDVPGVGKTSLAKAMATAIGAGFGRIQFTPDLMPTDIVGTSIWNQRDNVFEHRPGPVFHHVVLADEINRASPRTQSALLEAMSERQVTGDGVSRPLPVPFMVIATQNPLESLGTFPLPESQLDRFLVRVSLGYPSADHERRMLDMNGADPALAQMVPVATPGDIVTMGHIASSVHVDPHLTSYLLDLAHRSREHRHLHLGISPRALLGLRRAAQVRAAILGRPYVHPDDVKALAPVTLAHRLVVAAELAGQGGDAGDVIRELLDTTPVPTASPS
ncbi:MAG: MoxR family ATPase [Microthrixaceae bacterium]